MKMSFCQNIMSIINLFVNDLFTITSVINTCKLFKSYVYTVACLSDYVKYVRKQDSIIKLIGYNPRLDNVESLFLACDRISLKKTYCTLTHLYITVECGFLYDKAFKSFPNLTYLDYECDVNHITLTNKLFKHIPKLEYLRMSLGWEDNECEQYNKITNGMFKYLPNLKHLNCARMTNIDIKKLPKTLISLVTACEITHEISVKCIKKYTNLKYLSTCHREYAEGLRQYLPNLIYFRTTRKYITSTGENVLTGGHTYDGIEEAVGYINIIGQDKEFIDNDLNCIKDINSSLPIYVYYKYMGKKYDDFICNVEGEFVTLAYETLH